MVIPKSKKRCGNCDGCCRDDCGDCFECQHKKKFGGDGTSKLACLMRVCLVKAAEKAAEADKKFNGEMVCHPVTTTNTSTPKSYPKRPPKPAVIQSDQQHSLASANPGPKLGRRKSNPQDHNENFNTPKKRSKTTPQSLVKKHSTGPKIVSNIYQVTRAPTRIVTSKRQLVPDLPSEHATWAIAIQSQNIVPLTAAKSFTARTEPPKPKTKTKPPASANKPVVWIQKTGGTSMMRARVAATPASNETKNKLYRLKREMGHHVPSTSTSNNAQMVTDDGGEEEEDSDGPNPEASSTSEEEGSEHSESEGNDNEEGQSEPNEEESSDANEKTFSKTFLTFLTLLCDPSFLWHILYI